MLKNFLERTLRKILRVPENEVIHDVKITVIPPSIIADTKFKVVEAPKPSFEIQKMYDSFINEPHRWTIRKSTFDEDKNFEFDNGAISFYVSKHSYINRKERTIDRYFIMMSKPFSKTLEDDADKTAVLSMYLSAMAVEENRRKHELARMIDGEKAPVKKKIVLVDMDGVIADYYGTFCKIWQMQYPDRPVVPAEQLKNFYLEDSYLPEYKADILAITQGEQFFENLMPIKGAIEALKEMEESGLYDIFLCSSPDIDCARMMCHTEKARWVLKHLGKNWVKKMILTADKTLVDGDVLFDDKPEVKGIKKPTWKRVFFTHAFNAHLPGPRINTWNKAEWEVHLG